MLLGVLIRLPCLMDLSIVVLNRGITLQMRIKYPLLSSLNTYLKIAKFLFEMVELDVGTSNLRWFNLVFAASSVLNGIITTR